MIGKRIVTGRACQTVFVGQLVGAWCDECPHLLVVHREDHTCELCALVSRCPWIDPE